MDRIAHARRFLDKKGRDVERAHFAYHFGDGTLDALVETLARYQNADGGFGRGLEPDIGAPESNPFATELALLICVRARVPLEEPLIQRTLGYLEDTQGEDGTWRFSDEVLQGEMAPWFAAWTWPSLNPACAIAGLLRELGAGSEGMVHRVEELFDELARPEDLLGDEFYTIQPYAFYFLPRWEHPLRQLYLSGIVWWLTAQRAQGKLADAGHFFEFVRSPDTDVARLLPPTCTTTELDRLEAEQSPDGGWPSPYAEHWRGPATVSAMLVLKEFGRV